MINPIHLNKPPTYDGKDLSKFRPWWMKVESYLETYEESFPHDHHRINWVGSLLTDKAQIWHQQRTSQVKRMALVDRWGGYVQALKDRFNDNAEAHRNAEKMRKLKYDGDIAQYLTELLDLNEVVQWSGTTFQHHITRTIPSEISRLVYSRLGGMPTTDEDFISAIQEAGQIYENMLVNPGLNSAGKDGPTSMTERSRSGHRNQGHSDTRSSQGQNPSFKKDNKREKPSSTKDTKWQSSKEALQGIDQADIDQRKRDKISCWRCGRDNHHTLECFARKDTKGKDLPTAPAKVSATKRKKTEDTPSQKPHKKLRVDAIHTDITPNVGHRFTELELSDQDF